MANFLPYGDFIYMANPFLPTHPKHHAVNLKDISLRNKKDDNMATPTLNYPTESDGKLIDSLLGLRNMFHSQTETPQNV